MHISHRISLSYMNYLHMKTLPHDTVHRICDYIKVVGAFYVTSFIHAGLSVNKAALAQIMACHLYSAKPLSEPVLKCC